jgi:hypothetical protein
MKTRWLNYVIGFLIPAVGLVWLPVLAPAAPDLTGFRAPNCVNCHKYPAEEKLILGDFQSYSRLAGLITVKVGPKVQTVKYDPQTKVENAPSLKDIPIEAAVKVYYQEKPDGLHTDKVVVKPKIKFPENQILSVEEMKKLVDLGPEKGKFTLLDSRPAYRFQEERLPGAINQPFPNFDQLTNLLPQDKKQMVVFYCQGFT